jgi:ferrochelatase
MNTDKRGWAVLLLAHGAPEHVEDIPEFLRHIRGGRPAPEDMVREIARRYELIGGGSPLGRWTERQARALEARLGVPTLVGMRHWHPFIAETVAALPAGLDRLVVICLAPHTSQKSADLYIEQLDAALAELAEPRPCLSFIEDWHDHPLLIQAFAEKIRVGLQQSRPATRDERAVIPVILTAHSVPESTISGGDPYEAQARETAALVAAAAGLADWRMAFHSQGMTPGPWIGPTVESQIDELAALGRRRVFIAPIGFLCDNAEILYDVDIRFREYAQARGMELDRAESLNDSPLLIEALVSLALEELRIADCGFPDRGPWTFLRRSAHKPVRLVGNEPRPTQPNHR